LSKSVVVQILRVDEGSLVELQASYPNDVRVVEAKGLEGTHFLNVLIGLSSLTLPLITKVVIELIRARKHVSLKVDGVELTGLSEKNAKELLTQLIGKSDE
jgi:hypothetical protein